MYMLEIVDDAIAASMAEPALVCIALAADDAAEVIDAHAKELTKKVQSLEKEVDKAKEEIYIFLPFHNILNGSCAYPL